MLFASAKAASMLDDEDVRPATTPNCACAETATKSAAMAMILKVIEQCMGISMVTLVVQTIVGGIIFIGCSLIYIIKFDNEMLQFIMATLKMRKR